MAITVEDRPSTLLELLWIREAHELRPHGDDLPPLLADPPPPVRDSMISAVTRSEWEEVWPLVWRRAATHAGRETDHEGFKELQRTADGSPERAELLRRIVGPNWHDDVGNEAFAGHAYSAWDWKGMEAHLAAVPGKMKHSPERRDLNALVPAWRAGLTKIVTIPCCGEFTRIVTTNALLMTDATRDDSAAYRQALATFA